VWSRLGSYNTNDLDALVYHDSPNGENPRQLFEYWYHAACIIPLKEFRYRLPTMRRFRTLDHYNQPSQQWLSQPENQIYVENIMQDMRANGGARASDYERSDKRQGSWWDWKPAKQVLEHLYNCGEAMIANRINFNRVYDLSERVLPTWVDTTEPTHEEAQRHILEISLRSQGVAHLAQVGDYTHMKRNKAKPLIEDHLKKGTFIPMKGHLYNGNTGDFVIHRDHLPLLEQIADGQIRAEHTTFLNPFDNLFWAKGRDEQLWGFEQLLEAYKPEKIRRWGYYCLPILYRNQLIGRFDPKLERKTGTLRLKALYLEKGQVDEEMIISVAKAMRDFMRFHEAKNLVIERSNPPEFGKKLLAAL
jgi:hypothetical protein